ncbi:PepSY domain-containing protein [Parvibaculum sp.]|uniref:PepSY domain-containing protein n=1 Tax=Parvibaculum sp. TaxID=2024848 RepID=UPI0032996EA5
MTHKATWIALTITAFLALGFGPARADGLLVPVQWGYHSEQDRARDAVRSGQVVSPGQAKQAALSRYPGRFLDMSFGGNAYYVKIMTPQNRVVVVTVDAASGRVTGAR